jgi:hypothetical protein
MLQENYTPPIFVARCKKLLLNDLQRFKKPLNIKEILHVIALDFYRQRV